MGYYISYSVVLLSLFAVIFAYSDVHRDFNYDVVVNDINQLKHHLQCFIDEEPCSEIAGYYKAYIKDALLDTCGRCTSAHKHNAKVFLWAVKSKFPEGYEKMRKKFDEDNKYFDAFERIIADS